MSPAFAIMAASLRRNLVRFINKLSYSVNFKFISQALTSFISQNLCLINNTHRIIRLCNFIR